ncbi:MAG: hypothetical protein J6X82_01375, partial [Bacteroidales bacterium]|nr:hypothetical protein [Bacteroidales bacterium]
MNTVSQQLQVRRAEVADLCGIMAVLEAAKGIMRASGNTGQWINGYPSQEVVMRDIQNAWGYLVESGGGIAGYFAFIPSP